MITTDMTEENLEEAMKIRQNQKKRRGKATAFDALPNECEKNANECEKFANETHKVKVKVKVKEEVEVEVKEKIHTPERDEIFEKEVLKFWGLNEIANHYQAKILWECCTALKNSNRYDDFKNQFAAFSAFSIRDDPSGRYKGVLETYLGRQENRFLDGRWCKENWIEKLKTLDKPLKTNNQPNKLPPPPKAINHD